jgi:hypothetical protein
MSAAFYGGDGTRVNVTPLPLHTPGLWQRRAGTLSIEAPDGKLVANALCGTMRRWTESEPLRTRAEAEANADLLAMAPLMLARLETIAQWFAEWELTLPQDARRAFPPSVMP